MIVIFTDLDGTLLDYDDYAWQRAGGSIQHVREQRVPLVFCSSKTLQEQMAYQREMDISEPMVVEAGGAVAVPDGYFPTSVLEEVVASEARQRAAGTPDSALRSVGERRLVVLGRDHDDVLHALDEVREETGLPVLGFTEMTLDELVERTGLTRSAAMRAQSRRFSEAIHMEADGEAWERLSEALRDRGFGVHGSGPLATVVDAGTDKGRGVRLVAELFRKTADGEVLTVALGDGASDVPMFEAVDRAFLVEEKGGGWLDVELPNLEKVRGVGPHGWEPVVRELLDEPVRRSRPRAPR